MTRSLVGQRRTIADEVGGYRLVCFGRGVKADHQNGAAIIENAWGAAYHWISYGCIRKYQQRRDKHQGLTTYLVGLKGVRKGLGRGLKMISSS